MMQISHALPSHAPICVPGHRPHLVETRGAPRGHRIGTPCPARWHVECSICAVATVPETTPENAVLCWRPESDLFRIPLSKLADVRVRVAQNAAVAA